MVDLCQEDPSPWAAARRGWRVETLAATTEHGEFAISVVEAVLDEPLRCSSVASGSHLLLRAGLDGSGELVATGVSQRLLPTAMTAITVAAGGALDCYYERGPHRFVSFRFALDYLRTLLADGQDDLREGLARTLAGERLPDERPLALSEPLDPIDRSIAEAVARPPVAGAASELWLRAKAIELLSRWCFRKPDVREGTFFCSLQKRIVIERVELAKHYLAEHLDEPLELAAVAGAAGCSPHYLSRQFSSETGLTLSRYLRSLRIRRASELLAAGEANVSEAAVEVGYKSLSHFARAFQEERGMTPSEFVATGQRLGDGPPTP